jgi:penicillin amidase
MVWADKYGDIGWQAVGIAPIRKTHSGLVPINGDGSFEWEDYLEIIEKPNLFNPEKGYIATANQNVTPEDYERWDAIGYDWADPYRGERVNSILESKDTFNMEDMTNLQIDYFSIPSKQIINMSKDYITNNLEYFKKLIEWDNILDKNSIEAGIYIEWQTQIYFEFIKKYVPESVQKYLDVQIYKVIEGISKMSDQEKTEFLNKTFDLTIKSLIKRYGEENSGWVYGQENYKHVKIYHPLEKVVNDSIKGIIGLDTYPRGGDGFTPGSTSSELNQRSGGSFRVVINTKDWDNSFATNSPGQSGNPKSKFYKNLYEDWANDKFFPLLYSKSKVLKNLSDRKIYRPSD